VGLPQVLENVVAGLGGLLPDALEAKRALLGPETAPAVRGRTADGVIDRFLKGFEVLTLLELGERVAKLEDREADALEAAALGRGASLARAHARAFFIGRPLIGAP
jgi:hypothetical protein